MGVVKKLCSAYYFKTNTKRGVVIFTKQQEFSFEFWQVMISLYNIEPMNTEFYFKKISEEDLNYYMSISLSYRTNIQLSNGGVVECLIY